jgi:hypothetical protein
MRDQRLYQCERHKSRLDKEVAVGTNDRPVRNERKLR